MADRVVKVTLRAQIAEYKQGMLDAAASTRTVGTEAEKLAQKRQAFQQVGAAGMAMGVTIGAGLTMAVAKFADFDQAMSNVAATGQDARDNIDALRQAAIDAGAATVFSADESANAIEEMAKAGIDAKDVLGGGLTGALDLAAAGGLGVADAAGIAATALKVFNLEGSDMSHVADLLAAGAGKAMGDVTDLSQALAQGGQVAAATGLSIEETTATLAAFASQGLLGSDAGTSFKTMLQRLTPQSSEAKKKMDELGISAYDAAGEFIGMEAFAGNLRSALKDLTPEARNAALSVMFGSDAVRAANVVYTEGATGIAGWIRKVDDSGYAAETAATRLDNLKGDWEALMGALDSAMIGSGEAANGPLRFLVQELTDLVDVFNDMPSGAQQAVFWVGAVAAAASLAGGSYLIAVPKIAEYNAALATLGPTAQRAAGIVGGAMKGLGIIAAGAAGVAALGALKDALDGTEVSAAELTNTLTKGNLRDALDKALEGTSLPWEAAQVREAFTDLSGVLDQMKRGAPSSSSTDRIDIYFDQVSKGAANLATAIGALDASDIPGVMQQLQASYGLSGENILTLINSSGELKDKLIGIADSAGLAATPTTMLGIALGNVAADQKRTTDATGKGTLSTEEFAGVVREAEQNLSDMRDALDEIAGTALGMGDAVDRAQSAVNKLGAAAEAEGASLYGTNDASISLRDSMRDVEKAHRDAAEAILDNGGSVDDAMVKWSEGRQKIIDMRIAMGDSADEAVVWADTNLGKSDDVRGALEKVAAAVRNIPTSPVIDISITGTSTVYNRLMDIQSALRSVTGDNTIRVATGAGGQGGLVAGNAAGGIYVNKVKAFAAGGFEPGIYPFTPGGIHKLAEEYSESYISLDPKRRSRSVGVWQETGRRLGMSGEASSLSIEGASISGVLEIGGDGLARIVDGRISLYDKSQKQAAARGWDGRF